MTFRNLLAKKPEVDVPVTLGDAKVTPARHYAKWLGRYMELVLFTSECSMYILFRSS